MGRIRQASEELCRQWNNGLLKKADYTTELFDRLYGLLSSGEKCKMAIKTCSKCGAELTSTNTLHSGRGAVNWCDSCWKSYWGRGRQISLPVFTPRDPMSLWQEIPEIHRQYRPAGATLDTLVRNACEKLGWEFFEGFNAWWQLAHTGVRKITFPVFCLICRKDDQLLDLTTEGDPFQILACKRCDAYFWIECGQIRM